MAQKENQRIALTKKLLQEGLLGLLEKKSLDKISVTELCRESGINRATFYNHYTSPQELLNSIEDKMIQMLTGVMGNPKTADEATANVEAVCEFFYDNGHTILILHNCGADRKITQALYAMNQSFQTDRLRARYTRVVPAEGIHLISVFFYTGCYNLLLDWLKHEIAATPKQIAELLLILAKENFLD